jgi:hypothetical protein
MEKPESAWEEKIRTGYNQIQLQSSIMSTTKFGVKAGVAANATFFYTEYFQHNAD